MIQDVPDARIHQAYNWGFSVVASCVRMFPYLLMGASKRNRIGTAIGTLRQLQDLLRDTATQFEKLANLAGTDLYADVADQIRVATACLTSAERAAADSNSDRFAEEVGESHRILVEIKQRLRFKSPIRYRLWLLNPFRYFPRKLP